MADDDPWLVIAASAYPRRKRDTRERRILANEQRRCTVVIPLNLNMISVQLQNDTECVTTSPSDETTFDELFCTHICHQTALCDIRTRKPSGAPLPS